MGEDEKEGKEEDDEDDDEDKGVGKRDRFPSVSSPVKEYEAEWSLSAGSVPVVGLK